MKRLLIVSLLCLAVLSASAQKSASDEVKRLQARIARQLVERLSDSVKQHVGNAPQSDDLTMFCIMCS